MNIQLVEVGSSNYYQALGLRDLVLRKPLGLMFSMSDLGTERHFKHFVCLSKDRVIATSQLVDLGEGRLKMRQVAVHPKFQGQHIGSELVHYQEVWATTNGFDQIELNARESAVQFYQKLHYQVEGDVFMEVGIPHRFMIKRFSSC